MEGDMKTNCEECIYKAEIAKNVLGGPNVTRWQCRRLSPTWVAGANGEPVSGWPNVTRSGWCGEGKTLPITTEGTEPAP